MTNEELAYEIAKKHYRSARQITDSQKECYDSALEMAKWKDEQAKKEFANKVKKVSFTYKYVPNVASKFISKEMIYDHMLISLIEGLKRDGFVEIKETLEGDKSTIFMCINVLKNDFKTKNE